MRLAPAEDALAASTWRFAEGGVCFASDQADRGDGRTVARNASQAHARAAEPTRKRSECLMTERSNDRLGGPKAVLEHVRPTIVRRRVFVPSKPPPAADDLDEAPPPSSVDVARALASLRGDELRRLEALIEDDDDEEDEERPAQAPAPPLERKKLSIPHGVGVSELAEKMGMAPADLTAALVSHGFFALSAKASFGVDTVREIARALGWDVDVVEDPDARPAKPKPKKASGAKKKSAARRPK